MYPNPTDAILHFKELGENKLIIIYDCTSRRLIETKTTGNNISINVTSLLSTIYLLKLGL